MIDIQVMHDSSEIIFYNTSELPVKIIQPKLSDYPGMRVICHWHEDIELIYTLTGKMNYEINGKTILLPEHSLLFVNSRQLHFGFSVGGADCDFICVLFHPSLLQSNSWMYQTMVEPMIGNEGIEYLLFEENDSDDYGTMSACMREMPMLRQKAMRGYEWEVMSHLNRIWRVVFRRCEEFPMETRRILQEDKQVQREMVSYIFSHYAEPLTLEEIAASGKVSRSKCCVIFKKFLGESPIDFVNSYRLEKSCLELRNTRHSITEIALRCGFNHSSYFTKLFTRKYGCTPSRFRKTFCS